MIKMKKIGICGRLRGCVLCSVLCVVCYVFCVLLSDKDEEEMNARQTRRVCSPEWRVPGFPQPTNTQTNNQAAK